MVTANQKFTMLFEQTSHPRDSLPSPILGKVKKRKGGGGGKTKETGTLQGDSTHLPWYLGPSLQSLVNPGYCKEPRGSHEPTLLSTPGSAMVMFFTSLFWTTSFLLLRRMVLTQPMMSLHPASLASFTFSSHSTGK